MSTRVLLIEASPTEALRARLILERAGYQVSLAANGKEGLLKAAAEKPALILLDTLLPQMNGYEVCGKLHLDPQTASIPVVMLGSGEEMAELPAGAGMGCFLAKPYAPHHLVNKVKEVASAHALARMGDGFAPLAQMLEVGHVVIQDGLIIGVNPIAERHLGWQAAELIGKPWSAYLGADAAAFAEMLARAQVNGQAQGEFQVRVNGARPAEWWRIVAALGEVNGKPTVQLVCWDVTPQHQAAEELQHAQQALAQAKRARGDFLANMSHELRTPLHELMGMIDLALDTDLTPEQRNYLSTARASSNVLLELVSDILEFSEMEAGQLGLEEKVLDPWEPVEKTIETMASRAKEKGLGLTASLSPDVPRALVGDPRRLRQVLLQLVNNAIKFTERGEIAVGLELASAHTSEVELHFVVRDTGVGIPEDKWQVIFEPFQQADTSATRRYGGLGMGLAVARHLVQLMGGNLWVESAVGKGSTFHFTARLKHPASLPSAAAAALLKPARALQILLAEDSPTNQFIAVANLKKAGHTVTVANNGRKAVEAFENMGRRGTRSNFDLVLMDVAMPEMDGLEATRAIRAKEKEYGGHIPIVAMTAFTTQEYQEKCRRAGMDAYISKPVQMDEFAQIIERLLTPRAENLPAESKAAPPAHPPVDLGEALQVVGGDVDLMRDAVAMSLEEIPAQVAALKEAMARQDAHAVEAKAHRLKGIMGNVGGMTAHGIAQRLETMGENGNLEGGPGAVQALEDEIARVMAFYSDPTWEQRARECLANLGEVA